MNKIGIENIKLVLIAIFAIVRNIKLTDKPLIGILLSLGKVVKIKFKDIKQEVVDLDSNEKESLVNLIISEGFSLSKANDIIKALADGKKLPGLVQEIIK